ncbi:MAG: ankyrin repeat domain-containing protein [Terracidiphilus sp.]|jgi:hypothetical protein
MSLLNLLFSKNSKSAVLIEAVKKGDKEALKTLLEKGANARAKDDDGDFALTLACRKGHRDIAQLLIDHGADVNAKDKGGYTALMAASENYQANSAQLLLERGADVNAKTKAGWTAAKLASNRGCKEVMKVLAGVSKASSKVFRRGGFEFTTEGLYCPLCDSKMAVRGIWFRERESLGNLARRKMAIAHLSNSGYKVSDSDYYEACIQGGGRVEELSKDSGGGFILWFT